MGYTWSTPWLLRLFRPVSAPGYWPRLARGLDHGHVGHLAPQPSAALGGFSTGSTQISLEIQNCNSTQRPNILLFGQTTKRRMPLTPPKLSAGPERLGTGTS